MAGVLLGSMLEEAVKKLPKSLKPEAVVPALKKAGVKDEELQMSGIGVKLPEYLKAAAKDEKGRVAGEDVSKLVYGNREDLFSTTIRGFGDNEKNVGYERVVPMSVRPEAQNYKERVYTFENENSIPNASTHFGDTNYLMHTRVWDDLIDNQDTRVIGEIQSDLHQKSLTGEAKLIKTEEELRTIIDYIERFKKLPDETNYSVSRKFSSFIQEEFRKNGRKISVNEAKQLAEELVNDSTYENAVKVFTTKAAEAPWKTSWARKGIENEIKQAIADGKQQVAIPIKNSATGNKFNPTAEDQQFLAQVSDDLINGNLSSDQAMPILEERFPGLDPDLLENAGLLDWLYTSAPRFIREVNTHVSDEDAGVGTDALRTMHRGTGVQKWYETNIDPTAQKLAKQLGVDSRIVSKDGVDYRVIDLTSTASSKEFTNWFAGSKVVDSNNKPLKLYHGTQAPKFDKFESQGESNLFGKGEQYYFTDSADEASGYATGNADTLEKGRTGKGRVIEVYVNIKKPANLTHNGWNVNDVPVQDYLDDLDMDGLYNAIKKAGYDGIIYDGDLAPMPVTGTHYVVFKPEQIQRASVADRADAAFKLYAGGGALAYYMAYKQGIAEDEISAYMLEQGFTEDEIAAAKEQQPKVQQALDAGIEPEVISEYLEPKQTEETKAQPPELSSLSPEKQAAMKALVSGEMMPADELVAAIQVVKPNMSAVTTRLAAFMGDESSIQEAEAAELGVIKNVQALGQARGVNLQFEEGKWIVETPDGPVDVTPGILETILAEKGELVGSVAGGWTGAVRGMGMAGPVATPWRRAAGALTGGIAGAVAGGVLGTELDYLYQSMRLQEEMSAEIAAHKALTASEAAAYGEVLGLGLVKFGGKMWDGAKRVKNFVLDGNTEGARKALKETFFLSQDEIDEIVARFERIVDTTGMSVAEKEIKAVATSVPGAEALVKAASAMDPQASRAVVKNVSDRATQLLQAADDGTTETARVLKQDLDSYVTAVKTQYDDVKVKAASNPRNKYYKFNMDNIAVKPVLESLAENITDPSIREKFLLQMQQAQRYTDKRTFSDLIELRQLVNEFRFNKRITKPADYAALDEVTKGIDEKLEKGANWLFGKAGAKQWLDEFATARKDYAQMKGVQRTALYKIVNRPGVTPEAVSKAMLKYSDAIDGNYESVMSMLPKEMRQLAERDMISQLVNKYTVGSEGGIRATQFPMLAKDLSTRSFLDEESRQLVKAIDMMSDVFKNDIRLGQNAGMMKVPEFQSYLTADPVIRAKFELASGVFNAIKQRIPGSKSSREIALIKNAAKFLETPLNAKSVEALKKEAEGIVSLDAQIIAAQRAQAEAIASNLDQSGNALKFSGSGKVLTHSENGSTQIMGHRIATPEIARQLAIAEGISVDSKLLDDVLKRYGYKAVQYGSNKVRLLE